MAHGIKWDGSNRIMRPPNGVSEDQCASLHTFNNGVCSVSCWQLSETEIAEVVKTGRMFVSVWFGKTQPPVFIGSEQEVHAVVADFGAVWRLNVPAG